MTDHRLYQKLSIVVYNIKATTVSSPLRSECASHATAKGGEIHCGFTDDEHRRERERAPRHVPLFSPLEVRAAFIYRYIYKHIYIYIHTTREHRLNTR